MTISIPESVKVLVDREVVSGAFPSAGDYISALVEADHKQKALNRLEAQLMEGLDSPASEMTQQDWDNIGREGLAELQRRRDHGRGLGES